MPTQLLRRGVIAAAAAALLALTGCSGAKDGGSAPAPKLTVTGEKSGTLSIVTKFADPKYAPYFVSVAKAYEAANPKVKIDLQQVGDQPYKDKIRVLSAANKLPDIYFSWAGDFANKFVRAGLAADLTSVMGPDTEWGKTFTPASLKAFQYDGKNYGIPINLDGKYLAYNKTAFTKAGITSPPATFEDLLSACGKLKSAGYTPIALGNQFGWPAIHYITQLNAYDVPAEQLAKDYDPATGAFTDPGYITALQQFKTLADTCSNPSANGLSHEAAQANLVSGKAAMQYIESLEFQVLTAKGGAPKELADNWSFMRLPASASAPGDTKALTGAPDGFMVNAKSKQTALAVDFLKFFSNQQNASKIVKDLGWLSPVTGSVSNENAFPQLVDTLKDMGQASQFAIWLDTVTHAEVASAYLSGVEGMLNGDRSPQQVMQGVQQAAAKAKKQAG